MTIQNDFDDLHGQVSVLVESGYSDDEIREKIDADPEILGDLIETIRNE
jgi:hypothetical protein